MSASTLPSDPPAHLAYHEAGHVVMNLLLGFRVHRVTIDDGVAGCWFVAGRGVTAPPLRPVCATLTCTSDAPPCQAPAYRRGRPGGKTESDCPNPLAIPDPDQRVAAVRKAIPVYVAGMLATKIHCGDRFEAESEIDISALLAFGQLLPGSVDVQGRGTANLWQQTDTLLRAAVHQEQVRLVAASLQVRHTLNDAALRALLGDVPMLEEGLTR